MDMKIRRSRKALRVGLGRASRPAGVSLATNGSPNYMRLVMARSMSIVGRASRHRIRHPNNSLDLTALRAAGQTRAVLQARVGVVI